MPRIALPSLEKLWLALMFVTLGMLGSLLVGCQAASDISPDDLRAALSDVQAESAALDVTIDQGRAVLDTLPPGSDRDKIAAELDKAIAAKTKIDATAAKISTAIKNAETNADIIAAVLTETGKAIPPPYGTAVGLLGILIGGFAEARRRRTTSAATDVIQAIETAKAEHNGKVNFDDPVVKASLRSAMSTEARRLVEQAQAAASTRVRAIKLDPDPAH